MSSSSIGSTLSSIANGLVTALGNIVSAVVNFIADNADVIAVLAGIGIIIGLFTGLFDNIPFIGNILSRVGL